MRSSKQAPPWSLILGGGAVKDGISHLGLWDFLVDNAVEIDDITGTSLGAIVAAFLKNNIPTPVILDMFVNVLSKEKLFLFTDERPFMQTLVDMFDLKPQNGLRIVAFDPIRLNPVVFEGPDCDLVTALTASCAMPVYTRPVVTHAGGKKRVLIDGGFYRLHPTKFCNHRAIVSRLIHVPSLFRFRSRGSDRLVADVGYWRAMLFGTLTREKANQFYQRAYGRAEKDLSSLKGC